MQEMPEHDWVTEEGEAFLGQRSRVAGEHKAPVG